MKQLTIKLFVILVLLTLCITAIGCRTSKTATTNEKVRDSIVYVTKYQTDTVKVKEVIKITEPVYNSVTIPCDSLKYMQKFQSGKVKYQIIEEKGEVKVIFEKDTMTDVYKERYEKSLITKDSLVSLLKADKASSKEVVSQTFWQRLVSNLWFALFVLFFVLWLFGVTPKFLITKFFKG